jgi:hypothetical protein
MTYIFRIPTCCPQAVVNAVWTLHNEGVTHAPTPAVVHLGAKKAVLVANAFPSVAVSTPCEVQAVFVVVFTCKVGKQVRLFLLLFFLRKERERAAAGKPCCRYAKNNLLHHNHIQYFVVLLQATSGCKTRLLLKL